MDLGEAHGGSVAERVVGGRFRLVAVVGSGGYGHVWRAVDTRLGVEVAVKQVRGDPSASEAERAKAVERAESEARYAAKLRDHPNIVAVYDVVTESGEPWLVMRLVRGRTVAQEIRTRGRLPADTAGRIASGVLAALGAAHAAGIVHRDVKPANIMLGDDGGVLLTDFGIAKQHTATTQKVLNGTLPYMSPERLDGKDLPSGDLFALGATMYEMTEGVSPFARATPTATMSAVAMEQPDPPRHAGPLASLILALLEKDPAKRPDATAAARTLTDGTGSDRTTVAAPIAGETPARADRPTTGRRPSRRTVLLAGLGAAAATAIPVALALRSDSDGAGGSPSQSPSGASGHPAAASSTPSSAPEPPRPVALFDGDGSTPLSVAFAPSGTMLASAGTDGLVRVWDTATRTAVKTFAHRPVNLWNKPLDQVVAWNSRFTAALSVAFGPDGSQLAVVNGDGTVSLWNIADGGETVLPYLEPTEWNGATGSVAFGPRGGLLATTYDAPTVRLWDPSSRTNLATLATGDTNWVAQVAFSPDGRTLALTSGNGNPGNTVADGVLQLWDTESRTRTATLTNVNSAPYSVAFSRDGKTLANLRSDGKVTVWDVASRTATGTLAGPASGATCIAFGPGRPLGGGFDTGKVTVWDSGSGKTEVVLSTDTSSTVTCLAFSPDGRTIAATAGRLVIWQFTG